MSTPKTVVVRVRLSAGLHSRLVVAAERDEESVSTYLRRILHRDLPAATTAAPAAGTREERRDAVQSGEPVF